MTGADMIERFEPRFIFLIGQNRMALRESAALAILTGQAHAMPFQQQGAERQSFSGGPINAFTGFDRLAPVIQKTLDRAMQFKLGGIIGQFQTDVFQLVQSDRCLATAGIVLTV